MRALLVYNEHAGHQEKACSVDRISERLECWGWSVLTIPCREDRTPLEVRAAIEEGIDVVVSVGGDGTHHLVANGLVGTEATLGVLPCGTGNDFARALGLPPHPWEALEVLRTSQRRLIDLGWVNGRYFLNVASIGLSAEIARDIPPRWKRIMGRRAYLLDLALRIRHRRAIPMQVCLEESCDRLEAYQIAIANGCCFGGGFRISPEARLDEGLLDVIIVEPGLFNLARGWGMPGRTLFGKIASRSFRTRSVAVITDGDVLVNLDGEAVWLRSPLSFRVLPRSLSVFGGSPRA